MPQVDSASAPVIDAFRFVFSPSMRRQLSAEIRAQFEAFVATGLQLDHVNAHKRFHVHPTLLRIILDVGREFGMQAIRWPREPLLANEHASQIGQAMQYAGLSPWLTLMRRQIERAGLLHNDWMFGMAASGHMDSACPAAYLAALAQRYHRDLLTSCNLLRRLPRRACRPHQPPGAGDASRRLHRTRRLQRRFEVATSAPMSVTVRIMGCIGLLVLIGLVLHEGATTILQVLSDAGWILWLIVPFHAVPLYLDSLAWRILLEKNHRPSSVEPVRHGRHP